MKTITYRQPPTNVLFILFLLLFSLNQSLAQTIPFEVEDHFEIHNDPDIGVKLMPEGYCENTASEDFGFVFKRKKIEVNTGAPFPPPGECGDFFGDPSLEFYPDYFNGFGFVESALGTTQRPWSILNVGRVVASGSINGPFGSLYNNHIILPAGRNMLNDDPTPIVDDGVIFSPGGVGITSDIVMWSRDDIVMNFGGGTNQTDGQFAVTESDPMNVKFKVGPGGTIFTPDLPSTNNFFFPVVVIDPLDGQLYYQELPSSTLTSEKENDILIQLENLKKDNQDLRTQLNDMLVNYETQMNEIKILKESLESKESNN